MLAQGDADRGAAARAHSSTLERARDLLGADHVSAGVFEDRMRFPRLAQTRAGP